MEPLTIIGRIFFTFILAFIFGMERQRSHKPVGFGTFTFVSVGACGLALAASILYPDNPLPLLGSIVTGIGFLGAGALIKQEDRIFGFTTAAAIWLFAAIGVFIGTGQYIIGLVAYIIIWIVILTDVFLARRGIGSYRKKLTLVTKIMNEKNIVAHIVHGSVKQKLLKIAVDKNEGTMTLHYLVEGKKEDINKIPQRLYDEDWFTSFKIE